MAILRVHGFHRLSSFLSGQKGTKEPLEPTDSKPPFIHPGCLEGLHHPWSFDWQLYEASGGDRRFTSM